MSATLVHTSTKTMLLDFSAYVGGAMKYTGKRVHLNVFKYLNNKTTNYTLLGKHDKYSYEAR